MFILDGKNIAELPCALLQQFGQSMFGVSGVGEPCLQVHVLRSYVVAVLRFRFDSAQSLHFGERRVELIGGNAECRGQAASSSRGTADLQLPEVTTMPLQNGLHCGPHFIELICN